MTIEEQFFFEQAEKALGLFLKQLSATASPAEMRELLLKYLEREFMSEKPTVNEMFLGALVAAGTARLKELERL